MKKRGFTLIELMVVVVIIGILAAIAIPNFVKIVDKAKCASVKANQHTLQVTVEALSIDQQGRYPVATTDNDFIEAELPENFKNPYLATNIGINAVDMMSIAPTEGQVGYNSDGSGSFTASFYTIAGGCKNGITSTLSLMPGQ